MSSPDVAPISGRSGADVAVSLAGQAPPAMAPVPSVGQAGAGAEEAPSGVTEQTTAEVTPPPTLERMKVPLVLVVPPVVGVAPQVEAPALQAEVAVTAPSQEQPDASTVVSEGAVQSTPPAAQATKPEVGRTEGGHGRRVLGHRGGGGEDQREVTLGPGVGGSHSPARGESLLQWMDPQDPTSTLFSLDDATKSIEWGSLDEGISAMMDVLDQARVILMMSSFPMAGYPLDLSSRFLLSSCIFVFLTLVFFSVPHCS